MEVMFLLSFGEFVDFTPWNEKKKELKGKHRHECAQTEKQK